MLNRPNTKEPFVVQAFDLNALPEGVGVFQDSKSAAAAMDAGDCLVALIDMRANAEHALQNTDTVDKTRLYLRNEGRWWTSLNLQRLAKAERFKALAALACIHGGYTNTVTLDKRRTKDTPDPHRDNLALYGDSVTNIIARDVSGDDVGTIFFAEKTGDTLSLMTITPDTDTFNKRLVAGSIVALYAPAPYAAGFVGSKVVHSAPFAKTADGRRAVALKNGAYRPLPKAKARRPFFVASSYFDD